MRTTREEGYEGSTVTAMSQSDEAASWAKRSACWGDMPTPEMSIDRTVRTSSREERGVERVPRKSARRGSAEASMQLLPRSIDVMAGQRRRMMSSWRRPSVSRRQSWKESEDSVRQLPRETKEGMREVSILEERERAKTSTWFRRE